MLRLERLSSRYSLVIILESLLRSWSCMIVCLVVGEVCEGTFSFSAISVGYSFGYCFEGKLVS